MIPANVAEDLLIARCPVPNGRSRAAIADNLRRWIDHFPAEYHRLLGARQFFGLP